MSQFQATGEDGITCARIQLFPNSQRKQLPGSENNKYTIPQRWVNVKQHHFPREIRALFQRTSFGRKEQVWGGEDRDEKKGTQTKWE